MGEYGYCQLVGVSKSLPPFQGWMFLGPGDPGLGGLSAHPHPGCILTGLSAPLPFQGFKPHTRAILCVGGWCRLFAAYAGGRIDGGFLWENMGVYGNV